MHPGGNRATAFRNLLACLLVFPALPQTPPPNQTTAWRSPESSRFQEELKRTNPNAYSLDPKKIYSLGELIDIAEHRNPNTRISWEQAKQQAAQLGIERSSLYPLLTTYVLVHEGRNQILLGPSFVDQTVGFIQPAITLFYTVLDFGRRNEQINAAKLNLFAANFAFNDTHERIIFDVTASYYQLIGAQGEVEAASATLANATTVQEAVEARLKNGLATLPDVLEARSASAQAAYDLESARGRERVAHGSLSGALDVPPAENFAVENISSPLTRDVLAEPVREAIRRALEQRPDLLAQMAQLDASGADVKRAQANYYPTLTFSGTEDYQWTRGTQVGDPTVNIHNQTWVAQFDLRWTLFDGHERYNELDRARARQRELKARLGASQEQAQVEVWTAYSNVETALRQQEAAAAFFEAANSSYGAVLEAYRYGVKNFLDVVSAQRILAQARTAQVQARATLLTDVADLAFRTGDLLGKSGRPAKP